MSKTHTLVPNNKPKILNPISPKNINILQIKFSETNTNRIHQLTDLLQTNTTLTQNQWQQVCEKMDQIINNISKIIEETYIVLSIPTLINLTSKQGDHLPRKLQKIMEKITINIPHY